MVMTYGDTPPEGTWCMECVKMRTPYPRYATTDYNGHNYWVCELCYKALEYIFEEEFK